MTTGIQPTVAAINSSLTNFALQLRNLSEQINDFNIYIEATGTAGLETLGFAPADAATVVEQASAMATVAGFYYGTSTAGEINDFNTYLTPLWAGQ
jgi:hypothetical protein